MPSVEEAMETMEAVKYMLRQDGTKGQSDGSFIIGFKVHPDDLPKDLLSSKIGTRYFLSVCRIGDDEQPVVNESTQDGIKAVKSAGILCRNESFQSFMFDLCDLFDKEYKEPFSKEDETARLLHEVLGIDSRSKLRDDDRARREFKALVSDFRVSNFSDSFE